MWIFAAVKASLVVGYIMVAENIFLHFRSIHRKVFRNIFS